MKIKALISSVLLCISGCAFAPFVVSPIVTGVLMWKEGEAKKYYKEELRVMVRSVKLALAELKHPIHKESNTKEGVYIEAGEGDKFKIKVNRVKDGITEVRCRINIMGDKPYAELLYAEIDSFTGTIDYDEEGKPTKLRKRRILANTP